MSPSARELLLHILDETAYLLSVSDQLNQAEFLADPTLKRAFARSLEIIGEAVFWDRLRNGLGRRDIQGEGS
jgi:uncharacterized protein with HEPN domain